MTRIPHRLAAILCLLAAFSDQVGAASTTAAASAAPVLRGVVSHDQGIEAVFEVRNRDGSTSNLYLRVGETLKYNNATVLDINFSRVRISRPAAKEGEPAWLDLQIGYNADGDSTRPPKTQPAPNPALLALSTDELFAKCLAATGTDYAEAKAVMVSRPKEAEPLARKVLDNKDVPWQNRVLAGALAEEIADPKAYAAARMELIRVAVIWRRVSPPTKAGTYKTDPPNAPDRRLAYLGEAEKLIALLAKFPGLKGEMILKATADSIFPMVAEVASQELRRQLEEWKADREGPRQMSSNPPLPLTPEQFVETVKRSEPGEPAKMLFFARSQAALASAASPNTETRPLLKSLDPKEYASVLAECDRILQEAATKPATATQPAPATAQ